MTRDAETSTALVTGAASGIGRAVALLFCGRGWTVVAVDRDRPGLEETAAAASGGRLAFRVCDLASNDEVDNLFRELAEEGVRLDALVAAAGIASAPSETTRGQWDRVIETNLRGTFLTCLGAIGLMDDVHGGAIVTFGSVLGRAALPGSAAYSASKAGIEGLTRALAVDHAGEGIRVNCIIPGSTDTPMMWEGVPATMLVEARALAASEQPLGRLAEPIEQARVAYFLASGEASFMTGASVPVDGGLLAKLAATM